MLIVDKDGTIHLTRGDTARLDVEIENQISETGETYELEAGDVLRFTLKKSIKDTEFLIQKILNENTLIHLEPNDTKDLEYGKYVYDVELTTARGDVYTIIVPSTFEITKEVTT